MMTEPLILGIDLGTTACKAFVMTAGGTVVGQSSRDYPLFHHNPRVIEQHAQDWWRVVSVTARHAVMTSGRSGKDIRALSISSQGISVVPISEDGEVLRPAITWLDTRAGEEIDEILHGIGPTELFQLTGKRPNAFYSLPKMMWIKRHEPEVFAQTHRFLLPHDYIVYRLTGRSITDHSLASGTLAHDVTKLEWSQQMLDIAGIGQEMLPEVAWAGTPVSTVLKECAETLGVSRDAVVACGGQDQKCAALGAGATSGVVTVSLGTASAISAVTTSPTLGPRMRIPCFPYVVPDHWNLEGVIPTAGGALKWLKDAFFSGGYHVLDELAEFAFEGTSDLFFFPHLTGAGSPVWDPNVPGVLYGISLATDSSHVARAVLEGIAYQVRSNVDTMMELGVEIDSVKVMGGGSKSELWVQTIADVLGREVRVPGTSEAAVTGACILAGVAAGIYSSAEEAAELFAEGETTVEPDPERSTAYTERYARYLDIERKLV